MVPLDIQLYTFSVMVLGGVAAAFLFDLFRVVRGVAHPRGWLEDLGDIFFWLLATVLIFGVLILGNWGEIRFYVFLGLSLGVYLYYLLASAVIVSIFSSLLRCLVKVADETMSFLWRNVLFCYRWIMKVIRWPLQVFRLLFSPLISSLEGVTLRIISIIRRK